MRRSIAALAAALLMSGVAFGQSGQPENEEAKKHYLYEWTDRKGTLHITDGWGKVPEQYRDRASRVESAKGQEPGPEQQMQNVTPSESESEDAEYEARAEWQYRMREWKKRLADAEKELEALQRERAELVHAYGSLALAPPAYRQRAIELERQLKDVQADIDTARNMINTVLPDEARKAGVPPGWLRE